MFIRRGLIAGADSFRALNQLCGPAGAAEILLTGDMINAKEALKFGIVRSLSEPENLLNDASALATRIATNPPLAVARTRSALHLTRSGQEEALETLAKDALTELMRTKDHAESVAAFLEKRDPVYQGS